MPAELTALQTPLHFKQEDDKVLTQAKHAGKGKVLIPAESHSNILLRVPSSGECFLRLYQTALNLGLYLSSDLSAQLQARFCVQSLFTECHHPNFREQLSVGQKNLVENDLEVLGYSKYLKLWTWCGRLFSETSLLSLRALVCDLWEPVTETIFSLQYRHEKWETEVCCCFRLHIYLFSPDHLLWFKKNKNKEITKKRKMKITLVGKIVLLGPQIFLCCQLVTFKIQLYNSPC